MIINLNLLDLQNQREIKSFNPLICGYLIYSFNQGKLVQLVAANF